MLCVLMALAFIMSLGLLVLQNVSVCKRFKKQKRHAEIVAKQLFDKYKSKAMLSPKEAYRWTFEQVFDYLEFNYRDKEKLAAI
jgi:hypothetical protein